MKYCTKCLMPETRPRISFDEDGVCNACAWAEEKKTRIDWGSRWNELEELCEKYRKRNSSGFDCIIPVSGGKDSSYVSYMMKEKLGMHPLCITIRPPDEKDLGKSNLESFIYCGFNHIHITPDPTVAKVIDKKSFIDHGRPMHAVMMAAQAAIFKATVLFDIPFVMWGEEGETEYGGSTKLKYQACYDLEDSINIYLSGVNPAKFVPDFSEQQLYWWLHPTAAEYRKINSSITHWSYFENWDPYKNYLVAKEKMGLQEMPERNIGTYNNFGQNDTYQYDLYAYLMYLKFGFGRCTQDVGIDIRRGALTRKQALALVKKYDGEYPEPYIERYLKYYDMTQEEFDAVLDRQANKKLFKKENGRWVPLFEPN